MVVIHWSQNLRTMRMLKKMKLFLIKAWEVRVIGQIFVCWCTVILFANVIAVGFVKKP